MQNPSPDDIIDTIVTLYTKYSRVYRKTTQPIILEDVRATDPAFTYDPESHIIRERLIEHVGSLPIIATTLFPYLEDASVHLEETLTMLAIHDIGELVTGDEMAFTKRKEDKQGEIDAALSLLHPQLHDTYLQVEHVRTPSGKFAKAIDKIAPDFLDYVAPVDITRARYKHFMNIDTPEVVKLIVTHKRPYMLWNPFMTRLHIRLVERLQEKLSS